MSKNLTPKNILKVYPVELRSNGTYICEYRLMDIATNEIIIKFDYDSAVDAKRQITYTKIITLASHLAISDHYFCEMEEIVITHLQAKAITSLIIEEQKIINEHIGVPVVPNQDGFWVATDGKKLYFNNPSVKDGFRQKETRLFLFISNEIEQKELFKEVFSGLRRIK